MSSPEEPPTTPPERDPDPSGAVDPLDERLSAGLDGHETASASALDARGVTRSRDLAAARDLLAVPPPPLDDISRRRLVRTALDRSSASSRRASWRPSGEHAPHRARIGAVAAVVLAVLGLAGWGLSSLNLGSNDSKASSKAFTAAPSPPRGPVNLHDISNPEVLRRRVEAALGTAGAPSAEGTASTTAAPNLDQTTTVSRVPSAAACAASAPLPSGDTPQLLGTATFHATPAFVVVAREPTRTLVFVLAQGDCRLLTSQFVKR